MQDKEVFELIKVEEKRQQETINLIPSENHVSKAVLKATGSVLTNKYSEGYSGKRYYGGQIYIDKIEDLAKSRALRVFSLDSKTWDANVQPYSGSPANIAVYLGLAKPGDAIMGMGLTHGGHLTHGHPVNFSGQTYNFVHYGVDAKTHLIDYDQILNLAQKHKPKIIISGASAYPRIIDFKKFGEIAKKVGAIHMADISHIAGLIAAKVHPSPFEYADVATTTTHKTLRGPRGAVIFSRKDYSRPIDKALFPGIQGGPHENTIAAIAVAFGEALRPEFKSYAKQVVKNAKTLATELRKRGYELISGGTDNHLMLINLKNLQIKGSKAQNILESVGIVVNKNTIPFDEKSPFDPSGIRVGTPATTSRGMVEKDMLKIVYFIDMALKNNDNKTILNQLAKDVKSFAKGFGVPGLH